MKIYRKLGGIRCGVGLLFVRRRRRPCDPFSYVRHVFRLEVNLFPNFFSLTTELRFSPLFQISLCTV